LIWFKQEQLPVRGEYSSEVEGGAPVQVRYTISGRLDVLDYLDFILERAGWLDISGWAAATDERSVTLVASGPEALVGALEMACTLGPLNALVDEIDATAESAPVAAGFEIRR
jgi:acylphosphatase